MQTFADRLRQEIDYSGLLQKEVASMAGIKKRALDMYVGKQGSMPPADVAVRIAKVLHVSVEYLVTGEAHAPNYRMQSLKRDIDSLPPDLAQSILDAIHKIAEHMVPSNRLG